MFNKHPKIKCEYLINQIQNTKKWIKWLSWWNTAVEYFNQDLKKLELDLEFYITQVNDIDLYELKKKYKL